VLGAVFVCGRVQAAVPTTACDAQWTDILHAQYINHIGTDETLEDGSKGFKYGSNNDNFISESGNIVTFQPFVLFTPTANSVFKVWAVNSSCTAQYGDSSLFILAGLNTITYNRDTNEVKFNTEEPSTVSNGIPKYLGFDVWDGVSGSVATTYTYLVDLTNIQNPTVPAPVQEGGARFVESKPNVPGDEPEGKRPVLIIPGIMGSELYENGELVWINKAKIADYTKDLFLLESLGLDERGNPMKSVSPGNIVQKVLTVDIFERLISDLEQQKYINGENYFTFPYDWRLDLKKSRELLKEKIAESKKGFNKIDIVAHSMGGLLVKDYIKQYGSENINKLILVGTPHLGAPKAAKTLLEGDTDIPMNILNKNTMKQLSLNMPTIYQLLPNQKYFDIFNGYINFSAEPWVAPNILDYNRTREFLKSRNLNGALLDQEQEIQLLSELDLTGVDAYNIAGCGTNTQAGYRFNSEFIIKGIGYTSGDKTVPFMSARQVNIPFENKYYVKKAGHSELPSHEYARKIILDILTGQKPILDEVNASNGTKVCDYKGKKLEWKSPVEVHVYDQNRNHAGPTQSGAFENNLNIDYEIIDGEKFIFIPTDDGRTYTVEANGEELGNFDLVISDINNGEAVSSVIFNDVPITENSQIILDLYQAEPTASLDGNMLTPDSTLTQALDDVVPPQTSIETLETEESITVKLSASDGKLGSGIMYTKYSIDGQNYKIYTEPIEIKEFGNIVLKYYSVDNVGNNEPENTRDFKIAYDPGKVLGTSTGLKDGTLVLNAADNRTVYIIGSGGEKYGFISEEVYKGLGYRFSNLVLADISDYELGGYVYTASGPHPDGSLVEDESGAIWVLNYGKRFGFSFEQLQKSFDVKNIIKANWHDLSLPGEILE